MYTGRSTMFRRTSGRTLAPAFGVLLLAALPGWVLGQSKPAAGPPRFERDVQPILAANCFQCHGEDGQKVGLDLRTLKLMLQGGDSGPAITRGSAEKSLLIKQVAQQAMPPGKRKKLTDAQIAVLRAWI